jgi:hypothetical protein
VVVAGGFVGSGVLLVSKKKKNIDEVKTFFMKR